MKSIKQQRIAEQIRTTLSQVILREIRDPRVQGVTVMEVRVDRELAFADVYVHAFDAEGGPAGVLAGLASASGFLRQRLSKSLTTRSVPRLHFHWDTTLEYGDRMDEVLDDIEIPEEEE
jgi:ribosome-binding factor A